MPWLDVILTKNRVVNAFSARSSSYVATLAAALINERLQDHVVGGQKKDFLSRFIEAKKKTADVAQTSVVAWTMTNLFAGADTTAISLRAVIYYILKYPPTYARLLEELSSSNLSDPVTWEEARSLPYLDACIREALRLHPAVGLLLERIVPPQGLRIDGRLIRPGTIVGMNPWVIQRDINIYGEDADIFRPERWLEASEEHRKTMDRTSLVVGLIPLRRLEYR
jgi:cytochrome P450